MLERLLRVDVPCKSCWHRKHIVGLSDQPARRVIVLAAHPDAALQPKVQQSDIFDDGAFCTRGNRHVFRFHISGKSESPPQRVVSARDNAELVFEQRLVTN